LIFACGAGSWQAVKSPLHLCGLRRQTTFTMPCLLVLFALIFPRLVLFFVWLFSDYLSQAYHSLLWPIVGFLFMPLTTLAYAWAINSNGSVNGLYFFMVLLAALIDLGAIGGSSRAGRSKNG
jgi:hypothetical protein